MKRLLAFFLALLFLTGCAANAPAEEPAAEEPTAESQSVPEAEAAEPAMLGSFSAQALTGETVDQTYFANADLTILNIWATYCGPCKEEMPVLGELDRELENVQVLGIVTDVIDQKGEPDAAQVELALELTEAFQCDYPNLILNQSLAQLGFASLQAVPATLFIDREGYLVGMGFYGSLDEDGWRQAIAERLEMTKS